MTKRTWIIPVIINILFGIILALLFGSLLNSLMIESFPIDGSWVNETVTIWFHVYAAMIIYFLAYTIINILLYQQCYKKVRSTSNYSDYLKITLPITVFSSVILFVLYILLKLL